MGGPEIVVIAVLAFVLFGGSRIAELGKGLGRGISSFRAGLTEPERDEADDASAERDRA